MVTQLSEPPDRPSRARRRLSLIVPVLNEESNIPTLYQALRPELERLGADWELIFVDDGSTDGSAAAVLKLHGGDPRVKLLSLSRNFGHQSALTAGMDHASGDAVIMMDADLQHPPSLIGALVGHWEQGYEVVYTVRELTEDAGRWKRLTALLFYRIFRSLSGVDLPANTADFRLLDRKVIEAFRHIRERTRFLRGLTSWVGYRSVALSYRAGSRVSGRSKYGIRRMLGFGIDGLVSFSATPLYLSIYLGMMLALAGGVYFLYVLYSRLIVGDTVPGWTSLIILVMLIGGVQLSLMGIIGVYVGRVYEEAKQRPLYLVDRSVGLEKASLPPDKTVR